MRGRYEASGFYSAAYSQNRDKGKSEELLIIIEQISEEMAISGNSSAEEVIEYLENLAENPVAINKASWSEMENLPLLTPFMISSLIDDFFVDRLPKGIRRHPFA